MEFAAALSFQKTLLSSYEEISFIAKFLFVKGNCRNLSFHYLQLSFFVLIRETYLRNFDKETEKNN